MNKRISLLALLIACLSSAALCITCSALEDAASQLTNLRQDSRMNYSDMNLTFFTVTSEFGIDGLSVGEAVKFTAPRPGWKLKTVEVLGWSGFNETTGTFPIDRNIMIEIRDKDLNLLYKFADSQNSYFLSETGPLFGEIEIPDVAVNGDFYVVFYDRGAVRIGMENENGTGNSFLFKGGQTMPAEIQPEGAGEPVGINWIIEAAGE